MLDFILTRWELSSWIHLWTVPSSSWYSLAQYQSCMAWFLYLQGASFQGEAWSSTFLSSVFWQTGERKPGFSNHRRMTYHGRALMWWYTGTRKPLNAELCHRWLGSASHLLILWLGHGTKPSCRDLYFFTAILTQIRVWAYLMHKSLWARKAGLQCSVSSDLCSQQGCSPVTNASLGYF